MNYYRRRRPNYRARGRGSRHGRNGHDRNRITINKTI